MAGRAEPIAKDPNNLMRPELVIVGKVVVTSLWGLADIGQDLSHVADPRPKQNSLKRSSFLLTVQFLHKLEDS